PLHLARNGSRQVTLRGFSQPSDLVTHTVNKGDTAVLSAWVRKEKQTDVIWKSNGSYFYTLDWHEAQEGRFLLQLPSVQPSSSGIYSATYLEASPLGSAFFRLIVRGQEQRAEVVGSVGGWEPCGTSCGTPASSGPPGLPQSSAAVVRWVVGQGTGDKTVPRNARAACMEVSATTRTASVCAPLDSLGPAVSRPAERAVLGRAARNSAQAHQAAEASPSAFRTPMAVLVDLAGEEASARKVRTNPPSVLPDPGTCAPGHFGADCHLQCQCQNGGTCDRFSGCVCPSGWHGVHCEKSDRIPQILDMVSELEFNLETTPRINCAAAGNPFPVRGSVELRKPDGTVLLSTKAIVEPDRTTAEFEVPRLALGDSGLWECRVSTSGGQDSRRFRVNVKVPPVPLTAPRLLAKQSRQLVVSPLVSFSGDGPIASVVPWGSVSRPAPGTHRTVLTPDLWPQSPCCSRPPAPRHLHAQALSDSEIQLVWQRPEAPAGPISKYIVEVQVAEGSGDPLWMDVDRPEETSTVVRGLNASTRYLFRVRASVQGPGDWSNMVEESTLSNGLQSEGPVQEVQAAEEGLDQQLVLAVVGSVSATCLTILAALLTLACIRRSCLHRRRTFTYQSGSGEETILQFSSGTLTLTRRPKPQPEPLNYPVLEWEDITFEDLIGEGNFGQVIRAMIKKDGLKMNAAIKMLKEYASENDHRDFAGELEVLCKLGHHPNIINLLGACENRGYLYIAIEYAPYGNLLDFLRKSRVLETDPAFAREHGTASTLSSRQLLRFASDAANGMQYLSEKQFIHRDLAARNVLVGENLASKIADFGLSRGEEVYVKKTMRSPTCRYELMRQCWRDRPYERPPFAQIALQLGRMLEARKAYVNMSLFENFTYAGIDATAEEA
ncbi:hypothetical protein E2I00_016913, partial [Balaenoptera physalus]